MTIKATISLGLFSVPIKMEQTFKIKKTRFNWISPKGNRVTIKYFDSLTNEELDFSTIQTGYEISKDRFIILSKEEIKSLTEDKNKITINFISKVVPLNHQIIKSYHLLPDDKNNRPYAILHRALLNTKKVLIGTWFTFRRDELIAISSNDDALILSQLIYPNEQRSFKQAHENMYTPSQREISLAKSLLQKFSSPKFSSKKTATNKYPERLAALLDKKSENSLQRLLEKSLK